MPTTRPAMLLLFDIDGTLLWGATDAHRDAMYEALLEVHSVDASRIGATVRAAGRTDGEIARTILLDAGFSARRIDEGADAVREACCRHYAALCTADLSHTVLPGIRGLLEWLAGRGGVRLALLTGNYEPVARLKLARAGIGKYFAPGQGAFGSDAEDRAALPGIARRRAGEHGVAWARSDTIVIGDTPRDVACAHADEVRCVGVLTGPYGREELRDADAIAEDAIALRELLEEMLGR